MIIVIDGYNLLKGRQGNRLISESERHQFLHQLSLYGKRKKHKIVVVFDAGPSEWAHKEKINKVIVIYSGAKESADQAIKHYLADHVTSDLLLVTSDRELNMFASKHDIVSIDSQDFDTLLMHALQQPGQKETEVQVVIDEKETDFDTIMQQAAAVIPQKQDDRAVNGALSSLSKISKKDRALMKKLKKL